MLFLIKLNSFFGLYLNKIETKKEKIQKIKKIVA